MSKQLLKGVYLFHLTHQERTILAHCADRQFI